MTDQRLGTMTTAAEHDDASYLDFVEGLRVFQARTLGPAMRTAYAGGASAFRDRAGRLPETLDEARQLLEPTAVARTYKRLTRSSQEMNWSAVVETYRKQEPELVRRLDEALRRGPGSVQLDPSLRLPDYYAAAEFHIQPGSYFDDPLAGYIYHYGTKVFYMGNNNHDERQAGIVADVPAPEDGRVSRIVDLGCAIGQSTTAFKQRFPNAEVVGIDLSAPILRYAHLRAVELGIDVRFAQMPAEALRLAENSVDIVYAYILFHELPPAIGRQVIHEAYRILRPGGVFAVIDFPPASRWNAYDAYVRDYDQRDNGEPYSYDFCQVDLLAEFRASGFRTVEERKPTGLPHAMRIGIK